MKNKILLLAFALLFAVVPATALAANLSDTCYPGVDCDSGQAPYGPNATCQTEIVTTATCGAAASGYTMNFSCERGCFQTKDYVPPGCPTLNIDPLLPTDLAAQESKVLSLLLTNDGLTQIWDCATQTLSQLQSFWLAGAEAGSIHYSNGKVGIGTTGTTSGSKLAVASTGAQKSTVAGISGDETAQSNLIFFTHDANDNAGWNRDSGWTVTDGYWQFVTRGDSYERDADGDGIYTYDADYAGDFYLSRHLKDSGTTYNPLFFEGSNGWVRLGPDGTNQPSAPVEIQGRVSQVGLGQSTFFGHDAGLNDDLTTNNNTAVGYEAYKSGAAGSNNTALGYQSLYSNTGGTNNVAVGLKSMYSNANGGEKNTAVGVESLYTNDGDYNTAIGNVALRSNTTGNHNTAVGMSSLYSNLTSSGNAALGDYSLNQSTSANNAALGYSSLYNITTGGNNTAVGYDAGSKAINDVTANTTSTNSVYLGYGTKAGANGDTNETVVGYTAVGNGSNSVTLGNDSVTKTVLKGSVGIGTTAPNMTLDVNGPAALNKTGSPALMVSGYEAIQLDGSTFTWGNGGAFHMANSYFPNGVGVKDSTPYYDLDIAGTVRATTQFCLGTGDPSTKCISDWPVSSTSQWTTSTTDATEIYNNNTGNVGIGDTTPDYKLDVTGTVQATTGVRGGYDTDTASYFGRSAIGYNSGVGTDTATFSHIDKATSTGGFALKQSSAGQTFLNTDTGTNLTLSVNNAAKMAIQSDGDIEMDGSTLFVDQATNRVGVGDTTPSYPLDVTGTAQATTGVRGGYDTDTASYFGRSAIGYNSGVGTDMATFGHIDTSTSATGYALLQTTAGQTFLNSASGSLIFRTADTATNDMEIQADGDVVVDTSTFFVDATNNRVGINDTTPSYGLEVTGTAYVSSNATINGNATVNGSTTLNGDVHIEGGTFDTELPYSNNWNYISGNGVLFRDTANAAGLYYDAATKRLRVGGGSAPSYALDVVGEGNFSSGIATNGATPSSFNGIAAQGSSTGGTFSDSDGTSQGNVAVGGYGGQFSGDDMGGYFNDANDTGIMWGGYGNIGVQATGSDEGGYFYDWNNTGKAYVGIGNYGIEAYGSTMGAHFYDTDAVDTGNVYLGYGGYGVQAEGVTAVLGNGTTYDFNAIGAGANYAATSSVRWKKNIENIPDALNKVMNLRGVYFDWDKKHGGKHDMGMIAEEVGKTVPEIVVYEPDGSGYATGMDYGALTPILTEAIKQLKIEKDSEINELRSENQMLKDFLCEKYPDADFCNK
jgi:hypothetical protein